jgi:type IV pilus assembly protein PilB
MGNDASSVSAITDTFGVGATTDDVLNAQGDASDVGAEIEGAPAKPEEDYDASATLLTNTPTVGLFDAPLPETDDGMISLSDIVTSHTEPEKSVGEMAAPAASDSQPGEVFAAEPVSSPTSTSPESVEEKPEMPGEIIANAGIEGAPAKPKVDYHDIAVQLPNTPAQTDGDILLKKLAEKDITPKQKPHKPAAYHTSAELDKELDSLHGTETEMLSRRAAEMWHMPYVNLIGMPIDMDALSMIPQTEAFSARVVGFKQSGDSVSVAMDKPSNVDAQATVRTLEKKGYIVTPYLASKKSIDHCLDRYGDLKSTIQAHGGMIDIHSEALEIISKTIHTGDDAKKLIQSLIDESGEQGTVSRIIEAALGCAIALGGSDVHIEPQEEFVRLRLRIDGILSDIIELPSLVAKQISSRIKILSGMKLTVTKDAQDGRYTITYDHTEIEVRVSSIPGPYGEGIVMRILDPRGLTVSFEKLGIEPNLMELFKTEIQKPEGIILTSGPTGSGKTTTLYSFLQSIYDPEIKVITIEDPIEYHLAGIQQTQVDHAKGYDFLSGLRAAMRQDPEVVMVGEIRDTETATTAVQAAQTGHLVLSTIHTNNAAGIIPRLLVLGVNPSMLASVLRLAISQRLIRRLVPELATKRPASERESALIKRIIKNAEQTGKDMKRFGISSDMEITISEPGSSPAHPTGYKGRVGIFEAIIMTNDLEKLLEGTPSEREVRAVANSQPYLTLAEDAVVKILSGLTSIAEVESVIDLSDGLPDETEVVPVDVHDDIFKPDTKKQPHTTEHNYTKQIHPNTDDLSETAIDPLLLYLDELEHKPHNKNPEATQKIELLQDVILDMVKRSHGIGSNSPDLKESISHTITNISSELESLREQELENPDAETLGKLQEIEQRLLELLESGA